MPANLFAILQTDWLMPIFNQNMLILLQLFYFLLPATL